MIINICLALLAFFLGGQFPVFGKGFPSYFFWVVVLFVVAGVGYVVTYRTEPSARGRWLF